jgi:hypothetical protein
VLHARDLDNVLMDGKVYGLRNQLDGKVYGLRNQYKRSKSSMHQMSKKEMVYMLYYKSYYLYVSILNLADAHHVSITAMAARLFTLKF